jgi:hypothetical protein
MKRMTILFATLMLCAAALTAAAQGHVHRAAEAKAAKATESKSVTGEVVDMGCYLAHGAHGAKHVTCATKCIAGGMPMGILTSDGALYLLTLNHDSADPFNQLKDMAGKTVTVTGDVMTRNGMKGIDVAAVKTAATSAK